MEVPTTAAYVICVSIAGPALQSLGVPPLTAHLFVFWYALLSTITPPVCGAVFIAAGMVGENWLKVAMSSMALGVGLYVIPLAMVQAPALIELGERPVAAIGEALVIGIGLAGISYGAIAPFPAFVRVALAAGGTVTISGLGGTISAALGAAPVH
jgi:TRAP-type uncharacterized transport system fused permease subunit